jgi:hypothetical protein
MSFLLLQGVVRQTLSHPARVDKATGQIRPPYAQVQLECAEPLQDGQERLSIHTLTVEDVEPYEALRGSEALVEVGAFARGGTITFFGKRGVPPRRVPATGAGAAGAVRAGGAGALS